MPRSRLLPLLALAAAAGCAEDPSFSVRWRLGRSEASVEELTSVVQCTELGISRVRLTTRNDAGTVVDEREFACFLPEFEDRSALAPGPEVGPGTYAVTVTAIGHRGLPYTDPNATPAADSTGGDADEPDVIAFDAHEVTIQQTGENKKLTNFAIVGPTECDDGVDNDRDGSVDLADSSCRGTPAGSEFGDFSTAQVTVRPRLLGDNPHATCGGLGLEAMRIALAGPTPIERDFACGTTARTITEDLSPGTYTLSVTGTGAGGVDRAIPSLDPAIAVFDLKPAQFRVVDVAADFTIPSFLDEISAGFGFSLEYETGPDTLAVTSCEPAGPALVLERVRVVLLDEAMAPIPDATLYDGDMPIPLDGATTVPCGEMLATRFVDPLTWDDVAPAHEAVYVQVEAFPAGSDTACWGNTDAPEPAAPNTSFSMLLRRLSTEGACAD